MKCVVTGATGFVGRHLCKQLLARGDEIVALSRSGASLADGTPTRAVDLATAAVPTALLENADAVFHLAGIAHRRAHADDYDQVNHRATQELAARAAAAGAACFVYLSSVRAMGAATDARRRSESDSCVPDEPYGLSKWRAERALYDTCAASRMSVAVVRPGLVYGAGVKGNLHSLARAVRHGLPRLPAGGRRSLIAVEDLVELLCCIADAPSPGAHTWIATAEDYSAQQLVDALRAARGKPIDTRPTPRWLWRVAALAHDVVRRQPGPGTYDTLFGSELYDNAAVLAATRWRPRGSFARSAGDLLRASA